MDNQEIKEQLEEGYLKIFDRAIAGVSDTKADEAEKSAEVAFGITDKFVNEILVVDESTFKHVREGLLTAFNNAIDGATQCHTP